MEEVKSMKLGIIGKDGNKSISSHATEEERIVAAAVAFQQGARVVWRTEDSTSWKKMM